MDIDINMDEINNRFIKYNKNNIVLTGEQVDILNEYNIDYTKCRSITELINLIERNIDDDNYEDLDWVSQSLAEFNYYHNTNK
jgi:hypothetical protein